MKDMHVRFFCKLLFVISFFSVTNAFAFSQHERRNALAYFPHAKVAFGWLQYISQIISAEGCTSFDRWFPCGGIIIYSPQIENAYLEIGCGNYKDFRFTNDNTQEINISEEIGKKIMSLLSHIFSFFTTEKRTKKLGGNVGKDYKKVFFARLGFSIDSPLNYLINDPLNASKIDILLEFPLYYDGGWFKVENGNHFQCDGEQVSSNPYWENINLIIVPIRFVNRNFSGRISLLKINCNDISRLFSQKEKGNKKKNNNLTNFFLYALLKGLSFEFTFNVSGIVDTILSSM